MNSNMEIIYADMKLVYAKIGVPLKNTNRNSKLRSEIRLETYRRNISTATRKNIYTEENAGIFRDEKRKAATHLK